MRSKVSPVLQANRSQALANMADAVAAALETERREAGRRFTDYRLLSRRLGRNVEKTVAMLLRESDTTITTLADIGAATGHRLRISFERDPR